MSEWFGDKEISYNFSNGVIITTKQKFANKNEPVVNQILFSREEAIAFAKHTLKRELTLIEEETTLKKKNLFKGLLRLDSNNCDCEDCREEN